MTATTQPDLTPWQQEQVRRIAHLTPEPASVDPEAILPPGEEMIPDTPAAVIGRYLALLERWAELTARQTTHDAEAERLRRAGKLLAAEWSLVQREHQTCLAALQALPCHHETLLQDAWRALRQAGALDPRGRVPDTARHIGDRRGDAPPLLT